MQYDRRRVEINDRLAHTVLAGAAWHSGELAAAAHCIVATMANRAVVELVDQVLVFTFNAVPPMQARFARKDNHDERKGICQIQQNGGLVISVAAVLLDNGKAPRSGVIQTAA